MNVIDKLVGFLAPHTCFGCDKEGYVLCPDCIVAYQDIPEPRCAGCKALSDDSRVCAKCRDWLPLRSIFVSGNYEGINEALVKSLKFKFQRQSATAISLIMVSALKQVNLENTIVCPIPTAPARIRQRGFDHALLVSGNLAKKLGLPHHAVLSRRSNVRQLGSSRKDRFDHMQNEFKVVNSQAIAGKSVLLVDDVMTTGASLAAAAKTLKKAGAKSVSAVIFAQQN